MQAMRIWLLVSTLLLLFRHPLSGMPTFFVCADEEVNLEGFLKNNIKGTAFSWCSSNATIGLSAIGVGEVPRFTAKNATMENNVAVINYTTTNPNGSAQILEFRLVVRPKPVVIRPCGLATVCNGTALNQTITSLPVGATFKFEQDNPDIGFTGITTLKGLNFTALTTKEVRQISNITLTPTLNGCKGDAESMELMVVPIPFVKQPLDLVVCPSDTLCVFLSGGIEGTVFSWTNDNPSVGLAATGFGSLFSSSLTNQTGVNQVANIVVTPLLEGCFGEPKSFKITVKPAPMLTTATFDFCVNEDAHIDLKTNLTTDSTTVFSWMSNNVNTGIPPVGASKIVEFKALSNNAIEIVTTYLMVKATADGCSTTTIAAVNIKPRPVLYNPGNSLVSVGQRVAVHFMANIEGASFEWTNNETAIGLPSSGSGDIKFTAPMNPSKGAIVARIIATATLDGCVDETQMFFITASPTPSVFTPLATVPNNVRAAPNRQGN